MQLLDCIKPYLDPASDWIGIIGAVAGTIPGIRNAHAYLWGERVIARHRKHPDSVSKPQLDLAIASKERAADFTSLDVLCMGAGFLLLLLSFLSKLLYRYLP
jgi:hypothetical protein